MVRIKLNLLLQLNGNSKYHPNGTKSRHKKLSAGHWFYSFCRILVQCTFLSINLLANHFSWKFYEHREKIFSFWSVSLTNHFHIRKAGSSSPWMVVEHLSHIEPTFWFYVTVFFSNFTIEVYARARLYNPFWKYYR